MKEITLSKSPYKGTSDVYPEDMYIRNYLFGIWSKVARRFGYEEYDNPLIEDALLYKVKSGDDLANNQLYSFTDKGGREIALKPEMTPSLARMIAARKNEMSIPIRWFNIGRYYRYEKPQRGRTREFFQLNIDILGIQDVSAELEIMEFVMSVMEELKAPKETYELRVNNRYLLDYLFEDILNLDKDLKGNVTKAIDNYLKIDSTEFGEYLKEIGLDTKQIELLKDFLSWDIAKLEELKEKSRGAKELVELFSILKELEITNIRFCPYIVRGLMYYTGTVMEMYDIGSKENPRALFGGGRYDDLLEIFNEKSIPAFGLGWGDVTTLDYLSTYNLIPEYKTDTQVFVSLMDLSLFNESSKVTKYLRDNGINTLMQLTETKLSNQLKYANKKNIPWFVIVGEEEVSKKEVVLKNMLTSEQYSIPMEDLATKIL